MKKIQGGFAIEYKSGRRKPGPKSNSIWGDMDLKSVTRDLQEEAMPFLTGARDGAPSHDVSLSEEYQAAPLLTAALDQPTNALATQEIMMADENNTVTDTGAPASAVAEPDAPKKQRKPRAKKTASAAALGEATGVSGTEAAKPRKQTRGRKPKLSVDEGVVVSAPAKRGRKAAQAAAEAPVSATDEIADLLQLEEENQRLRKLLAEKLRAENADLRKRLKLN
ncbi:transcriptional regulator [Neorhizobium lilium]|uniref:Transcriptional regulator n=1 Tax=Neorhizobium lilium TaxID=2503024 RepID=A0A3S3SAH7_9HYPH|nr:transcriptional regulator [Neorhizobium lilium]RWX81048.1 transcriptional regulator [Neorhizobium lilium]